MMGKLPLENPYQEPGKIPGLYDDETSDAERLAAVEKRWQERERSIWRLTDCVAANDDIRYLLNRLRKKSESGGA